ncbi:hypothetical protein TUM16655_49370 [Enterobacter cloacae]|nr:hypothetical protein EKTHUN627_45830 [Enterobacter kobei]GJK01488.1 hypothetical protein TUM16655_49370 [Enterobacter cloacae]
MPEKVTSLNGLKVTSEYCSYKAGSHNKDYVKFNSKIIINQYLKYRTSPFLPQTSLW